VLGKYFAAVLIYAVVILISVLMPLTTVFVFDGEMSLGMTFGGYIGFFLLGASFIAIGMFISSLTENQLVSAVITIAVFSLLMLMDGMYSIMPTSRYFSLAFLFIALVILLFIIYRAIKDAIVTGIIGLAAVIITMIVFFITPTSFDGLLGTIMESLSVFQRYAEMFSGVFAFGDIVFFISVSIFFLFLTYQMVEKKRWNQ
jgi:ABC-2 type transport system permease protein